MTGLLDLPLPFLLLLPISIGGGVDLFLTVLVLSLSGNLGWVGVQQAGFLSPYWVSILSLAILYLLELAAELRPRPALLGMVLLSEAPEGFFFPGVLAAVVVSAFTHVLSWGRKLYRFLNPHRGISRLTRLLAEDAGVVVFLLLTMDRPELLFLLSGLLLLLGLFLGGSMHQVVRFGFRLMAEELTTLLREPRWREGARLPSWISGFRPPPAAAVLRAIPAGLLTPSTTGKFRDGWFVEVGEERWFLYQRLNGPGALPLQNHRLGTVKSLDIARRVSLTTPEGTRSALFLQRKGPTLKSHKSQETLDLENLQE